MEDIDKEKNVRRVENFLYDKCNYTPDEAIDIFNECLRNARGKKYQLTSKNGELRYDPKKS